MLSSKAFKVLAVRNQTTELNIRREYAQNIFLSYFYQKPLTRGIFFKGGTALRIIHNSPRFSEDLDFSSLVTDFEVIEGVILDTLKDIKKTNIKVGLIESKKTSGGYLAIIEFKLPLAVNVQLEISFRDKNISGELVTIVNDFVLTYSLMALKQEVLVSQKIQALLDRKKPRDFYDLYFMLRANMINPEDKKVLSQILLILKKRKVSFDKELLMFLPRSHWLIIKDFKRVLKRELGKYV